MTGDEFEDRIAGVASLAEPQRRALYRFIVNRGDAVSKDEAAAAMGVARTVAAFHLDRLVADGLLTMEFRRLTGRQGPGAGRPAKLYRRAEGELSVSLPARQYDLAARLLAAAVNEATETGIPVGRGPDGGRQRTEGANSANERDRRREAAEPAHPPRRGPGCARRAGLRTAPSRHRSRARQLPVPCPGRRTTRPRLRYEPRPAVRDGRSRRRRRTPSEARAVGGQLLRPSRRKRACREGPTVNWAVRAVFGPVATIGMAAVLVAGPYSRSHAGGAANV